MTKRVHFTFFRYFDNLYYKTIKKIIILLGDSVYKDSRMIHGLDDLTGIEFERLCAKVLERRGYTNIRFTPATNDFGIDIIAESMQLKFAIQCKRSKASIGNKAVQEALSGKVYYNCDAAVVVTNQYFTNQAIQTAKVTNVILWDRNVFLRMMQEANLKVKRTRYPGY